MSEFVVYTPNANHAPELTHDDGFIGRMHRLGARVSLFAQGQQAALETQATAFYHSQEDAVARANQVLLAGMTKETAKDPDLFSLMQLAQQYERPLMMIPLDIDNDRLKNIILAADVHDSYHSNSQIHRKQGGSVWSQR